MTSVQNVFVTGEGQAGAYAELEKRKFTAEEGVRRAAALLACCIGLTLFSACAIQDHLTLLNGTSRQNARACSCC